MPAAMPDIDLEGPNQWGKLVSQSASGRESQFEADFGNGFKVVTFVIWADGEGHGKGQ